jgi:hypothetical protein
MMKLQREEMSDEWMDAMVKAVMASGGTIGRNEYGTPISIHVCSACGDQFTVCPPSATFGDECLAITCPSYDPARDAEVFFAPDDPELIEGNITDGPTAP